MNETHLSEKVRQLIQKAQIVSFTTWYDTHPTEAILLFQAANEEKRYLTDEDCQHLQNIVPATTESLAIARQFKEQVDDIIHDARTEVLKAFPTITQPGGALYPQERSEACWRDFWNFLRCITYGIAGEHVEYTSAEGLQYLQLLYQEVQVPLDAMVVGLEGLKTACLNRVNQEQKTDLAPYFDHLIERLKKF